MKQFSYSLALALTVGLASGCDLDVVQPPTTAPSTLPSAGTALTNGTIIAGLVKAPDGVISTGGGNVISTGGGNVISTGGGNVISTGGGNFNVLAVNENVLANTEVYVADAAGNKIPTIPSVMTDAQGKFTLSGVPADRTFVVVAKAKTADGKDAQLQTLAKTTDLGTTADVNVSTTLVTAGVVKESGAKLGNFNPASFATATQVTARNLDAGDVPDLSNRAAIEAQMAKLMTEVAELRTAIDEIKKELLEIKQELKDLRADIEKLKARPAANPADPSAAPQPGASPCDQIFVAINANGDTQLTYEEWMNAWRQTGTNEADIEFLFGYYDSDYDFQVSRTELERFCFDANSPQTGDSGSSDGEGVDEPDEPDTSGDDDDVPVDSGDSDEGDLGGDDDAAVDEDEF